MRVCVCARAGRQSPVSTFSRKVGYNLGYNPDYKVTIPRSRPSLLMKSKAITMGGQEDVIRPSVFRVSLRLRVDMWVWTGLCVRA